MVGRSINNFWRCAIFMDARFHHIHLVFRIYEDLMDTERGDNSDEPQSRLRRDVGLGAIACLGGRFGGYY